MYKRYCPKCGKETDYDIEQCTNCGTAVEKLEYVKTHDIEHKGLRYAGFWIRLLASFIDDIVLLAFIFTVEYLVGIENIFIGIIFPVLLYYAYFESSTKQGTLGKQVVGIKVIDGSGSRI